MDAFLFSHGERLESFKKGKRYAQARTCSNFATSNSCDFIALYKPT